MITAVFESAPSLYVCSLAHLPSAPRSDAMCRELTVAQSGTAWRNLLPIQRKVRTTLRVKLEAEIFRFTYLVSWIKTP